MTIENKNNNNDKMIKNLVDWANPPSIIDLNNNYTSAKPIHDEAVADIDRWIKDYEAKAKNRGKNRSKTSPKTIKKTYNWTYPIIEEPMLKKKDIVSLEPRTSEDYKPCLINEIVINQQIQNEMNFTKFVNDSSRVLVQHGTLIVKIGWNRKKEIIKKVVPLMQTKPMVDPQTGQIAFDPITGAVQMEEVKVGTEIQEVEELTKNHPFLEVCDYDKVIIDPTAKGDISRAQFIIYEYDSNLSNLKKNEGYGNLEFIDTRDRISSAEYDELNFDFKDNPRKRLTIREYWGFWDVDNTGKTEMILVTYVDNIPIEMKKNPLPYNELPFEICHFEPIVDSNYGEPDAEIIRDNQENIGALTRATIDIVARSAIAQEGRPMGYLDILNKRKYDNGEDYEYNPIVNPRDGFHMHVPPEIPSSLFNLMQKETNEIEELTGRRPFQIGNGGSLGSTATAVRTQMDATAKRELSILRRYTSMFERAVSKIIAMNRLFLTDDQVFRISDDNFLVINREKMFGRFDVKVKVSTPEQDKAKIDMHSFMLQTLGNTMPFEMTQKVYAKIADLGDDPELAQDIREFENKPDPLQQEKLRLEIELLKAQVEVYKSSVGENQADRELKLAKADELHSKIDMLDLDFIHKSEGTDHLRDLEKQQQKSNAEFDKLDMQKKLNPPQKSGSK